MTKKDLAAKVSDQLKGGLDVAKSEPIPKLLKCFYEKRDDDTDSDSDVVMVQLK